MKALLYTRSFDHGPSSFQEMAFENCCVGLSVYKQFSWKLEKSKYDTALLARLTNRKADVAYVAS